MYIQLINLVYKYDVHLFTDETYFWNSYKISRQLYINCTEASVELITSHEVGLWWGHRHRELDWI